MLRHFKLEKKQIEIRLHLLKYYICMLCFEYNRCVEHSSNAFKAYGVKKIEDNIYNYDNKDVYQVPEKYKCFNCNKIIDSKVNSKFIVDCYFKGWLMKALNDEISSEDLQNYEKINKTLNKICLEINCSPIKKT